MKLKPLGERALVRPVEHRTSTASGIVLPGMAQQDPQTAKVLAVGRFENGNSVSEGDLVLIARYSRTEMKPDHENYPFLDAEDPLGIVEA